MSPQPGGKSPDMLAEVMSLTISLLLGKQDVIHGEDLI